MSIMKSKGFTIVELLIVIVIIAILATLAIFSYTAVRDRAENTKTMNSVAAYARAIYAYAATNGSYPNFNYPCLGKVMLCGNMTDATGACNSVGNATYVAGFDEAIATNATSLPEPSRQQMDCNGRQYMGAYYFSANGGKSGAINYFLKGGSSCGVIGGTRLTGVYTTPTIVSCYVFMPDL